MVGEATIAKIAKEMLGLKEEDMEGFKDFIKQLGDEDFKESFGKFIKDFPNDMKLMELRLLAICYFLKKSNEPLWKECEDKALKKYPGGSLAKE